MISEHGGLDRVKQIMRGLPLPGPAFEDPQEEIAYHFQHAAETLRGIVQGEPPAGQPERIRVLAAQTPDPAELQRLLQAESWVPLRVAAVTAEGVALKIPNPDNN